MLTFDRRAPGAMRAAARYTLTLPYEARCKCRGRVRLDGGEEAGVVLAWGESLRDGDLLATADGVLVRVVAAHESVMIVRCSHPRELAAVAYHLGNRHVPVEIGEGTLKLAPDHVLKAMVQGLGAQVEMASAPFDPEPGAYGAHDHGPGAGPLARRLGEPKQAS
jgi:urease accessory protein